jgi:hypothetical protein
MDLMDQIAAKRFLGNEFLLWLWYLDDTAEGAHRIGEDFVEVHFDDRIQLEAALAEAETSDLKGGAPAHSPEAHKALQTGKRVSKAKLRFVKGEREWVFSIDAGDFAISAVKIPNVLSKADDEPFFERLFLIEEFADAWKALYRAFLEVRLSDDWEKTRGKLSAWIAASITD